MFGSSWRPGTQRRPTRCTRRAQTRFERLDPRIVLSAASIVPTAPANDVVPALESAAFNVAPQGTDKTVFMSGNTYAFTAADFGFSDPGDVPPDLFLAVKITTLPPRGTLTYAGSGVGSGQFIPASQLGNLRYTVSGVEEPAYASFTFQVQDDGGPFTGGGDLDPTPNTFTFFADTAETNFVAGLYNDLLNRTPDAGGLINWLGMLDGGATRLDVATALWETPEHRGIQVDGYYQQFFDRVADPAGRQAWINAMLGGMSEETVMASFMSTTEYQVLHQSDEAFVNAAYADLFGRAPEAAGQNFWVTALATGQFTRAEVAERLIDTRERHLRLVDSYYNDFLNRDPDSEGLFFWTDQLDDHQLDDQAVAELLLATIEYYNLPHSL